MNRILENVAVDGATFLKIPSEEVLLLAGRSGHTEDGIDTTPGLDVPLGPDVDNG